MFALAAANTTGSLFTMILIYAVIIGGFWFLLMRPQKKEQKRVAAMIAEMEVGDTEKVRISFTCTVPAVILNKGIISS